MPAAQLPSVFASRADASGTNRFVRRVEAGRSGYTCVESFCGPGGIGLGLQQAGFDLRLAFDNNTQSVKTYSNNVDSHCMVADASDITVDDVLNRICLSPNELDLFSGGPPCQGFSKQKRGAHLGDDRNRLVLEFVRIAKGLQPRFFIFENVAIFGQKRGEAYVEAIECELKDYCLYPHFYNSANYGLAQTRQRFIVVGRRRDVRAMFCIPNVQTPKPRWKTVRDAIGDLPEPPADYSVHASIPNHQAARVTPINVERFAHVPPGGGWQAIPERLRLPCHQNVDPSRGGWPDVYGRLEWDGQCPTITGGFDSFTRGRYGHPCSNRPLTPREAARLQGFPDWYTFYGTRGDVRSQIGNAVPPPLARAIGEEIYRSLLVADGKIEDTAADSVTGTQGVLF